MRYKHKHPTCGIPKATKDIEAYSKTNVFSRRCTDLAEVDQRQPYADELQLI
jgi:hypothetical protein